MKNALYIYYLITLVFVQSISAQNEKADGNPEFVFDCSTCHTCAKPTKQDPCQRECMRHILITISHSPEEGPGVLHLRYFSDSTSQYQSVMFTHRIHSEMSAMSGGCAMCHHFNPPGNIVPCKDCHELNRQRRDVSKPDLLAAFHRQCMDCHRMWQPQAECVSCHQLRSKGKAGPSPPETTGEARVHPDIIKPRLLTYETDYDEGKIVSFYHNEHTDIYGFDCQDCHTHESCVKCHDKREVPLRTAVTVEEQHINCSGCHNTENNCSYCHGHKVRGPFDHFTSTGFNISKYHGELGCKQCHKKMPDFSGLKNECKTCHRSWDSESFQHRVTGLILDETHSEIDCGDCHQDSKYTKKPACDNCHDEDIQYPRSSPGKRIRLSGK